MLSTQKILVLSDDNGARRTIMEAFEGLDAYDVSGTDSRIKVLERLAEDEQIDLLLIDLNETPTANIDFLTELKQKFRSQKAAIITADKRQTLEILVRGAADIVMKPFDAIELTDHINNLLRDKRSCRRFELGDCNIHIVLLNQDGVRLEGRVDNICLDGAMICVDDVEKADSFFAQDKNVDILFQPAPDKPLVKIFRGNVARIINGSQQAASIAVYLTPERNVNFLDDFVTYFKIDLDSM